jgi:hypothetical protein
LLERPVFVGCRAIMGPVVAGLGRERESCGNEKVRRKWMQPERGPGPGVEKAQG